jgi:hypothetical protein
MGAILSSKVKEDGKVILEVCVDYDEALQLKGHMDQVHIFSEKIADIKTNMVQRGKNESTRYFLIPRHMRSNLGYKGLSKCQRIDTKSKIIFIYMIDKMR